MKFKMLKKQYLIAITLVLLASNAEAGPLCGYGHGGGPGGDLPASPIAQSQIRALETKLCIKFGCPKYSFAQSHTTNNAMAWSDGNNAIIRYNPSFMNSVFSKFGFNSSVAIFAHELGHIIDLNSGQKFTRYELESRADQYAGCSFALFGNAETDMAPFIKTLLLMPESSEYPSNSQRMQAVRDGYKLCK